MIEFRKMPRGSYRYEHDGLSADVWQVCGDGWRFTVLDDKSGIYQASGQGFASCDAACEAALIQLSV